LDVIIITIMGAARSGITTASPAGDGGVEADLPMMMKAVLAAAASLAGAGAGCSAISLIAEKPRHGYDLIRAIEDKFGGAYAPSPGAVYPTLTLLEEQDYIAAEAQSGTKKLYQITEAGRGFLDENAVTLKGIQSRMDLAAHAFSVHSTPDTVREAVRTLKQALHMRRGPWTPEEAERVRKLLEATARQIVGPEH
jgi:DNA-binding PadR family transcriptional regulator